MRIQSQPDQNLAELITPTELEQLDRKHDITYKPMSAAEFWWNHLSFDQRLFISSRIHVADTLNVPIWKIAYLKTDWASHKDWPIDSSARII